MVNNPNSLLQAAIAGQTILSTTTLQVTTATVSPLTGGGTANTSFLDGSAGRPNAMSATVTATFWIETVQGSPNFFQLQYSQLVLLNFNTLSWPHVTVGTLKLNVPIKVPIWKVDPRLPVGFIPKPGVPIPVLPIDPVLPIKPVVPIAPIKPAGNK
jgi:prepilin-type processing-associated H-X9-DG protein